MVRVWGIINLHSHCDSVQEHHHENEFLKCWVFSNSPKWLSPILRLQLVLPHLMSLVFNRLHYHIDLNFLHRSIILLNRLGLLLVKIIYYHTNEHIHHEESTDYHEANEVYDHVWGRILLWLVVNTLCVDS